MLLRLKTASCYSKFCDLLHMVMFTDFVFSQLLILATFFATINNCTNDIVFYF